VTSWNRSERSRREQGGPLLNGAFDGLELPVPMSRLVVMNGGSPLAMPVARSARQSPAQDRADPRRDVRVSHMDTPGETDDALAERFTVPPASRARDHEANVRAGRGPRLGPSAQSSGSVGDHCDGLVTGVSCWRGHDTTPITRAEAIAAATSHRDLFPARLWFFRWSGTAGGQSRWAGDVCLLLAGHDTTPITRAKAIAAATSHRDLFPAR